MTRNQLITLQERIGTTPDGFWGPKSIQACQRHLRAMMPKPNPWPKQDAQSLIRFYGTPGEKNLVNLPVNHLPIRYAGNPVKSIRCHGLVADSLLRVLADIASGPHAKILTEYAGCYNYRPMRNGTRISTHAWGIAIDLAAEYNANSRNWPVSAAMPIGVMESFAREGWLAAGAFWGRDAMHFQATQ
jgi:hypothetical protein